MFRLRIKKNYAENNEWLRQDTLWCGKYSAGQEWLRLSIRNLPARLLQHAESKSAALQTIALSSLQDCA